MFTIEKSGDFYRIQPQQQSVFVGFLYDQSVTKIVNFAISANLLPKNGQYSGEKPTTGTAKDRERKEKEREEALAQTDTNLPVQRKFI